MPISTLELFIGTVNRPTKKMLELPTVVPFMDKMPEIVKKIIISGERRSGTRHDINYKMSGLSHHETRSDLWCKALPVVLQCQCQLALSQSTYSSCLCEVLHNQLRGEELIEKLLPC